MGQGRRALDDRLLDLLGDIKGRPFDGSMWRVVREGRSPLDGSRGAGRWNTPDMSVLYGASEADGAIAEVHFHLSRGQSVFPSKMRHHLHELAVSAGNALVLADMEQLLRLGVEQARYRELLYDRTQEIAAAAAFMGFDGLIAPSARWTCQTIVLFLDTFDPATARLRSETNIDWKAWRVANRQTN